MILLIDNYDSFTYNVLQRIGELGLPFQDIRVVRNDTVSIEDIRKMAPSHLVISPGPGYPSDAGVSVSVVRALSGTLPILGICLGHQAIGEAFGARITHAVRQMHGKRDRIRTDTSSILFAGIETPLEAGRYHSLSVDPDSLPSCLRVTALADDGTIMGIQHVHHPTFGVQFHPESILTDRGGELLHNFLTV